MDRRAARADSPAIKHIFGYDPEERIGEKGEQYPALVMSVNLSTSQFSHQPDLNQLAKLEELGCDMAQGFYFAHPLSSEAIPSLLASGGVNGP